MRRFFHARLLLLGLTAAVGASCGGERAGGESLDPAEIPAGALRGEVVVYTLTFDDGTTDDRYALRVGGDERNERPLKFASAPELPGGATIDVWGTPLRGPGSELDNSSDNPLLVSHWQPVRARGTGAGTSTADVESNGQPLIAGAPIRPRSFAFVLVDIGAGVNITAEEATRRLFGTEAAATPSVRQYFMEASYGRQDVAGKVFGPLKYTITGCDTRGMSTALRPMIPGTFDHYLWYIGSRVSSCGWSGLASGGTVAKPSRDTWYNASAGCVVLVQEPGHNFGMRHSSAMKCPNASFIDVPTMVCTHSEYGDSYDPMGRGCRHMNGAQKAYLGWYGRCNVVEVLQSGSYTLLPTELPCDGTQVLQVAMPKTRPFYRSGGGGSAGASELTHYYLELRAPLGIDKGLVPSVQIRASGDTRQANQRAEHTWFLDMNPATATLDGLGLGGTFADPMGTVKFTVEALDATRATVKVEITGGAGGANKCLDGTILEGTGPGPETCAAAPFSINGAAPPVVPDGGQPPPGNAGGGGGTRDAGGTAPGRADAGSGSGGGGETSKPDAGARPGNGPGAAMPGGARDAGGAPSPTPAPGESAASPQPVPSGGCSCALGARGGAPSGGVPGGAASALLGLAMVLSRTARRRPATRSGSMPAPGRAGGGRISGSAT